MSNSYAYPPLLTSYPSLYAVYPPLLYTYPSLLTRYPTTCTFPPLSEVIAAITCMPGLENRWQRTRKSFYLLALCQLIIGSPQAS